MRLLLAALWPRDARFDAREKKSGKGAKDRGEHWSYKEVILLSEVRNSIVHGNGEVLVERSRARLEAAGWIEEELAASEVLRQRRFNDLLRFKRAVRTIANEVIASQER